MSEMKICERCGKPKRMMSWERTCYQCLKEENLERTQKAVREAGPDEEVDTWSDDYVICPYCGEALETNLGYEGFPEIYEEGEQRGANMIAGELAEHWAADSQTVPTAATDGFMTALVNNMEYASFINDGHRVDKHFVPGLYIDPATGLLSMDLKKPKGVGLVVGTKTTYVEGLHITDAAKDAYEEAAEAELDKLTREVFE